MDQKTKISTFFKTINKDLPSECNDIENFSDNTETTKKRKHSFCQNANDVTHNITNKTPTKIAVLLKKTPSPLKSPLQKKVKNSKKTPVKNLFKQHLADISSFNVGILERLVS